MKRIVLALAVVAALLPVAAMAASADRIRDLTQQRDFDAALEAAREYAEANPRNADAWHLLGRAYMNVGEWDDAIDAMERAVELNDTNEMRHALGAACREKARRANFISAGRAAGKWKEQLQVVLERDPANYEARRWYVGYLANAPKIGGGDKDAAVEMARETIQYDDYRGRTLLGYALLRKGELDDAMAAYNAAIEAYPDSAHAYGGVGSVHFAAERYDDALAAFERELELDPEDAEAIESLGDCHLAAGRSDDAERQFRRAVEVNPYYAPARYKLAKLLDDARRTDEAIAEYETLLELTPTAMKAGDTKKRLRKLRRRR